MINLHSSSSSSLSYGGHCSRCSSRHQIPCSPVAIQHALKVIQQLETTKRIDYDVEEAHSRPELSTDYLWTKGPGRMLGVMVCSPSSLSVHDDYVVLKAFSGQMSRHWQVEGWVGPVAGLTHENVTYAKYREITDKLSTRINQWNHHLLIGSKGKGDTKGLDQFASTEMGRLKAQRKSLSHELMQRIQKSYLTLDRGGRPLNLLEAYLSHQGGVDQVSGKGEGGLKGFPAGTGDCSIPKLLHACRQLGLQPLSAVEWWHGSPPNTATRQGRRDPESSKRFHLSLYPPCVKCETILGAMLCDSAGD
jgi:hypothetical protein